VPLLTRCFVKASLGWLALALALGVLLAAPASVRLPPLVLALAPVYFHALMVGWVTQLIFGVSLWMFPRAQGGPRPGSGVLGWGIFAGLNAGLLVRMVAEPAHAMDPRAGWGAWLVLSAALQWAAGLAYVWVVWPRVRAR
jgi:hypothetical protein